MRRISVCFLISLTLFFFLPVFFVFAQTRGELEPSPRGAVVTTGKQWAVFIAIDKYREWANLSNPVKDAREIQKILKDYYIIDKWEELFDEKASTEEIRKLFNRLRVEVGRDDSVFVFHAGHGFKNEDTDTGAWIPYDAGSNKMIKSGWILHNEIRTYLDRLPAKHVFLISDSCYSGDLLDQKRGEMEIISDYPAAYKEKSRQAMSSGASEEVYDVSEFASRLIYTLRNTESAYITPDDLLSKIKETRTTRQLNTIPILAVIPNSGHILGGSFLFFRKQQPSPLPPPDDISLQFASGSVTFESDVAGEILIDGMSRGIIKAGGTVTITNVSTGKTEVAVKESDGTVIKAPNITVLQGQNVTSVIERPVPEGLTYEIIDGKSVTITKYSGKAVTVYIPERIQRLPVTTIGSSAFSGSSLTSVTIPSSVTAIGNYAFYDCSKLTDITIPSSVTTIGDYAFKDCKSLTSVTIPSSVTTIGRSAFSGSGLTSVTIPSAVTAIGNNAFKSLENITVDSRNPSYASIEGILFDKNIKTIIQYPTGKKAGAYTIPSSVTTIGDDAFSGSRLTSVTIPSSVTTIGEAAFEYCKSLTSVTIPSSVTTIGDSTFSRSGLTSVTIPSSVTTIGDSMFSGSSLTSVTIPFSVTTIGSYAFKDCKSLENITVDGRNPSYASNEGILFDKNIKTIIQYPIGKKVGAYTLPSSVTTIGNSAFYSSSLTSVIIPSSVTTIGNYAFYSSSLTSVTIPSSVTTIGSYAFSSFYSSSLTSATMSRHTQVGSNAFRDTTRIIYRD